MNQNIKLELCGQIKKPYESVTKCKITVIACNIFSLEECNESKCPFDKDCCWHRDVFEPIECPGVRMLFYLGNFWEKCLK